MSIPTWCCFISIDFTFVVIVFCMVAVSVEVKLSMVSMVDVWSSFVISFVIVLFMSVQSALWYSRIVFGCLLYVSGWEEKVAFIVR